MHFDDVLQACEANMHLVSRALGGGWLALAVWLPATSGALTVRSVL